MDIGKPTVLFTKINSESTSESGRVVGDNYMNLIYKLEVRGGGSRTRENVMITND